MQFDAVFLQHLSFWLLAGIMIFSALGIVFHRSIVYSAMMMLMTFLTIAGVFALLNAPFLAAAQVLVYGVGLTIVMIFGIMLTGDKPFRDPVGQERSPLYWTVPMVVSGAIGMLLVIGLLKPLPTLDGIDGLFNPRPVMTSLANSLPGALAIVQDGGIKHIAVLLFSKYLVAFELASVLLLLAMIGAILLAIRKYPEEEGEACKADVSSTGMSSMAQSVNNTASKAAATQPAAAAAAGASSAQSGTVKTNV